MVGPIIHRPGQTSERHDARDHPAIVTRDLPDAPLVKNGARRPAVSGASLGRKQPGVGGRLLAQISTRRRARAADGGTSRAATTGAAFPPDVTALAPPPSAAQPVGEAGMLLGHRRLLSQKQRATAELIIEANTSGP
jgi:hypothetical protein